MDLAINSMVIWVCLKIGYIPNEIAIYKRDNDHSPLGLGVHYFQTHPFSSSLCKRVPEARWFIHVYPTIDISKHRCRISCPIWVDRTLLTWEPGHALGILLGFGPLGKKPWDFDTKNRIYHETRGIWHDSTWLDYEIYEELKFHQPKLGIASWQ